MLLTRSSSSRVAPAGSHPPRSPPMQVTPPERNGSTRQDLAPHSFFTHKLRQQHGWTAWRAGTAAPVLTPGSRRAAVRQQVHMRRRQVAGMQVQHRHVPPLYRSPLSQQDAQPLRCCQGPPQVTCPDSSWVSVFWDQDSGSGEVGLDGMGTLQQSWQASQPHGCFQEALSSLTVDSHRLGLPPVPFVAWSLCYGVCTQMGRGYDSQLPTEAICQDHLPQCWSRCLGPGGAWPFAR